MPSPAPSTAIAEDIERYLRTGTPARGRNSPAVRPHGACRDEQPPLRHQIRRRRGILDQEPHFDVPLVPALGGGAIGMPEPVEGAAMPLPHAVSVARAASVTFSCREAETPPMVAVSVAAPDELVETRPAFVLEKVAMAASDEVQVATEVTSTVDPSE